MISELTTWLWIPAIIFIAITGFIIYVNDSIRELPRIYVWALEVI